MLEFGALHKIDVVKSSSVWNWVSRVKLMLSPRCLQPKPRAYRTKTISPALSPFPCVVLRSSGASLLRVQVGVFYNYRWIDANENTNEGASTAGTYSPSLETSVDDAQNQMKRKVLSFNGNGEE